MTLEASEVVVGANGRVYVDAAESAVFPDDMGALDSGWAEVGYVSEDGVTFTDGKEIEDIQAWQSFHPVRKIVTARSTMVEFVMRQWNEDTVALAFGGGSVSRDGGVATYLPPTPGEIDLRAMIVEWEDGEESYRLVLPRGIVTGEVAANVTRTAAADLPISFEVTPEGLPEEGEPDTYPWYLLTDAAAFALT